MLEPSDDALLDQLGEALDRMALLAEAGFLPDASRPGPWGLTGAAYIGRDCGGATCLGLQDRERRPSTAVKQR